MRLRFPKHPSACAITRDEVHGMPTFRRFWRCAGKTVILQRCVELRAEPALQYSSEAAIVLRLLGMLLLRTALLLVIGTAPTVSITSRALPLSQWQMIIAVVT
jgi:hypothetical protein